MHFFFNLVNIVQHTIMENIGFSTWNNMNDQTPHSWQLDTIQRYRGHHSSNITALKPLLSLFPVYQFYTKCLPSTTSLVLYNCLCDHLCIFTVGRYLHTINICILYDSVFERRNYSTVSFQSNMISPVLVYTCVVFCAIILSIFNVTTISVLLVTPSLRSKTSTYPLISLLVGCLLQALTAAPAFVYKELARGTGKCP